MTTKHKQNQKVKRVYFDHAATTPLEPSVSRAMQEFQNKFFGNPNSIHYEGQQARARIDFARAEIAASIFAQPQEIVFTSGATESNNMALKGAVSFALSLLNQKPHVVTTMLEHQSVYNPIKEMEQRGIIEATYVKPDKHGRIAAVDVIKAIKENTVLVSTIFVSNEIGTVVPVREIGKLLREFNQLHQQDVLFHIDAVQAYKFYNCHVEKLGVDLITLSAHKIGGPKGVGALYVKSGVKIDNLLHGGSQEYGLRPGTQNSVGIIGFGQAVKLLGDFEQRQETGLKIRKLSDQLIAGLKKFKNIELNGPVGEERTADNINFTIKGADQEMVIAKLDLAGYAVSTGSACVSGSAQPSHVILSLGKNYKSPAATVRVTLGKDNTLDDVKNFLRILKDI